MIVNQALVGERVGPERRLWSDWEKKDVPAAYLGSLLFASGHACVEDMFYGLMAHSLPVSKYAVDASVIDYLVEVKRKRQTKKERRETRRQTQRETKGEKEGTLSPYIDLFIHAVYPRA